MKIQTVSEPKHIPSKKLTVQELAVADASGALRLSIWEDEIGKMEQTKSYRIELSVNMMAKDFFLLLRKNPRLMTLAHSMKHTLCSWEKVAVL